ncbi:MAG: DinB family protein [Acidobacteriota bacterium]|nr:DinB family protein [Acidobacteriota bacterium]
MLRQLLDYNRWANRLTFDSLRQSPGRDAKALRAFVHLLIAEREWLLRLKDDKDTTGFDFWPELSPAECETLMNETHAAYEALLDSFAEDDLARVASYKNSKGVAYRTSFRDILTHVAFHSAYHRGQVAMAVRAGGGEPAYTDYIAWVRENDEAAGGGQKA